jgi:hypothetical protein
MGIALPANNVAFCDYCDDYSQYQVETAYEVPYAGLWLDYNLENYAKNVKVCSSCDEVDGQETNLSDSDVQMWMCYECGGLYESSEKAKECCDS